MRREVLEILDIAPITNYHEIKKGLMLMKKAKQIGSLALAVLMLLAMIGCRSVDPADTAPPATSGPESLQGQVTDPTAESTVPSSTPTEPQQPSDPTVPSSPTEPSSPSGNEGQPQGSTEGGNEPQPSEPPATVPVTTAPAPTEHTHSYTDKVVAATCTAGGYTIHTCSCGHSYTDSSTAALGHLWGPWSVEKEATVTEEGREIRYCTRCWTTETNAIPVLEAATELWTPATEKEAEIARLFLEYINQFRAEEGSTQLTYLPGMTQVAQYRSRQLVTNLAHDTTDKREALAYYKYGTFKTPAGWDPSEYYYEAETKEAIGKTNLIGSPEDIARELATACRNSAGHWRYVGSSDYSFSGVGVACIEGETYLCIMVGRTNYG